MRRSISALVASLVAAGAFDASAQAPFPSLLDPGILSGGGPATTGVPEEQPYLLGWSVAVTPPAGLLETPLEAGGVAVDPRSRWVYAGTREGDVVCVVDGLVRWRTPVGGAVLAAPVLHRERLVVPTAEGVLVVLNKVTGAITSRAILGEELITQPRVVEAEGRTIALVGSSAETLFAVDLEFGERLWRSHRDAPTGFTVRGFARPVVVDGVVYAGFSDGWVQALTLVKGSLAWERQISPPGDQIDLDALASDGVRLYVASYSGGVYALEPGTGTILWRTPIPGANRLALDGPFLFVGAPGSVQMLRTGDGVRGWTFDYGGAAGSALQLVEGLVVFAELDGPLYFVDRRTGQPAGAFSSGDGFSSPPGGAGNALFALSNGGRLYALGVVP